MSEYQEPEEATPQYPQQDDEQAALSTEEIFTESAEEPQDNGTLTLPDPVEQNESGPYEESFQGEAATQPLPEPILPAPRGIEYSNAIRRTRRREKHAHTPIQPAIDYDHHKRRRRHGHGRDGRPFTSSPWFMILSLLLCLGAAVWLGIFIYQRDQEQALRRKLGPAAAAAASGKFIPAYGKAPDMEKRREASALLDEALKARNAGDVDKAIEFYRRIQSEHPWVRDITLDGVILLLGAGRAPEALNFANTAIQSGYDLSAAQIAVGLIAQSEQKLDAAVMAFEDAHYADPFSADVLFYWSEALRKMGRSSEAVQKLEGAVVRSSSESSLYLFTIKLRLAQLETQGLAMDYNTIQAVLDNPQLPGEDYLCAAAVTLANNEIPATRELIARAGARLPPTFFRFLLGDPLFSTVGNHPQVVEAIRGAISTQIPLGQRQTAP